MNCVRRYLDCHPGSPGSKWSDECLHSSTLHFNSYEPERPFPQLVSPKVQKNFEPESGHARLDSATVPDSCETKANHPRLASPMVTQSR